MNLEWFIFTIIFHYFLCKVALVPHSQWPVHLSNFFPNLIKMYKADSLTKLVKRKISEKLKIKFNVEFFLGVF